MSEPNLIPEIAKIVKPEHFSRHDHSTIYATLLRMAEAGHHIDAVTVGVEVKGKIDDHSATLGDLVASAGSAQGAYTYAEHIALLWRKRRFVELCGELSHIAGNGSQPDQLGPLWAEAETIAKEGLSGIPSKLDFADISQLLKVKDVPFICAPFAARDDVTIFGAMYGTGKSWTAYHLCFSICSGNPFMDHFEIAPSLAGPAIYFDFENTDADISRIIRHLTGGEPPSSFYLVRRPKFKIDTSEGLLTLQRYIDEVQPAIIVLDSLSKTHTKLETRPEQIGPVMYGLQCLARDNHVAILVLHHYGKMTEVSKTPESRLRGSTAIGDNADAIFSLQTSPERTIIMGHEKARHGQRLPSFEFAIEDQDGIPKTVLRIKTLELKEASMNKAREIRSFIASMGKSLPRPVLFEQFVNIRGWSEATFKRALKAGVDKYVLVKTSKDRNTYYDLPPQEETKETPSDGLP